MSHHDNPRNREDILDEIAECEKEIRKCNYGIYGGYGSEEDYTVKASQQEWLDKLEIELAQFSS